MLPTVFSLALSVLVASCTAAPNGGAGGTSTRAPVTTATTAPPPATTTTVRRPPPPAGRDGIPAFTHVFVVVMENLGYDQALATPGFAALADRFAAATGWYAVAHPSLPNYLALTSGGTWGVTSDCVECFVDEPDLGQQLTAAGVSWAAYMEGIPAPCFLADYGGVDYAAKHDPFRYYLAVRRDPALCDHIVPLGGLAARLAGPAAGVPRFVWVTPDLCHDGHDCPPAEAAAWLDGFVGEVTASAAWRHGGVLFVTWDEGNGGDDRTLTPAGAVASCCGGGRILTIVAAPGRPAGARVATPYDDYSLLATVEDAFDLPLLGGARRATPLRAFFTGAG